METTPTTESLRKTVMRHIAEGGTRMRPAWHFVLLSALWSLGLMIAVLTVILLVSFVIFSMRQSGVLAVSGLGARGFGALASALPWALIGASAVFVVVLELLARHFAFAYRRPLAVSLAVVIVLALVGGILFERAPMHRQFFERAMRGELPVAGPMYQHYGMGGDSRIHPGIIASVQGDAFTLMTRRGLPITVHLAADTNVDRNLLVVGMPIVVLGDRDGASISALGIMPAPDDILWGSSPGGGPRMRIHMSQPLP